VPKQATWLRRVAVAAIVGASFVLPTLAAAQADQPAAPTHVVKAQSKKHAATTRHRQSGVVPRTTSSAQAQVDKRCTWPYQNQFPPCMSTWPAGSPSYHGPRPGPTFDDE